MTSIGETGMRFTDYARFCLQIPV